MSLGSLGCAKIKGRKKKKIKFGKQGKKKGKGGTGRRSPTAKSSMKLQEATPREPWV